MGQINQQPPQQNRIRRYWQNIRQFYNSHRSPIIYSGIGAVAIGGALALAFLSGKDERPGPYHTLFHVNTHINDIYKDIHTREEDGNGRFVFGAFYFEGLGDNGGEPPIKKVSDELGECDKKYLAQVVNEKKYIKCTKKVAEDYGLRFVNIVIYDQDSSDIERIKESLHKYSTVIIKRGDRQIKNPETQGLDWGVKVAKDGKVIEVLDPSLIKFDDRQMGSVYTHDVSETYNISPSITDKKTEGRRERNNQKPTAAPVSSGLQPSGTTSDIGQTLSTFQSDTQNNLAYVKQEVKEVRDRVDVLEKKR